ncbi:cAMP-specific 3',5'-cyclic phosphodiesterase 7B [Pyricularia oryzae 70-15]|uniref:Phosphodiesterase n=4 Tax=Pyricularia oryzae TaxID=318829 RepID=G4MP01_PYRO7|nr:cAMP-specific 3',5'-cyclic phosphodiesterase 7B [Pyricularia oryzae 70-15]ACX31736.1 high-affinity cAMP phosphodiesterase [Pyricularia oryzae]ELQ36920.1 cAMP-specific 3',5'-cyclic phosphodiesterase 7B [Pyricularia oryzae Y34]EHA57950.1 cAMP-specific 3',5'-cyclic phosphodiesterase 7B [Pyricularia oryzae 70-15]KAI7924391.1 cAMP-specific 3' [Pyricularia oryzae]KAI7931322.1 cAMP-specific 3' [Pyricularia oryzae]
MENAACNLIYVDRSIRQDRIVRASSYNSDGTEGPLAGSSDYETQALRENVQLLLEFIGDVHLVATGASCLTQLFDLLDHSIIETKPIIVLIDVSNNEPTPKDRPRSGSHSRPRTPSRTTESLDDEFSHTSNDADLYGTRLLQRIVSESHLRNVSSLVVPISLVGSPGVDEFSADVTQASIREKSGRISKNPHDSVDLGLFKYCLDLGATDVMVKPLKCVTSIQVHAYQAYKEASKQRQAVLELKRGRKRSWVGVDDAKPYAYLREDMVSSLMGRICRPGDDQDDRVSNVRISVSQDRRSQIAKAVSRWHFCAHDFSDDELIVAATLMLKHALAMPELERWRMSTDQLSTFLIACRAAYNNFVPYHNFRHVIDVLQATFNFLVQIGSLPPFPPRSDDYIATPQPTSPIATLMKPFEALTLLVTAVGHDVGHPGVNNGFLVTLNAPLAQLYNDRSVLESFHCAAYSQILRRYWPAAFEDLQMRNLMISSILATDMGLHFDYMKKLGDLQEKLHENNAIEGWNGRVIEEHKALACAILIKCADISNVARKHDTALKWTHILSDEFSRQASMETDLGIQSSLMAPPKKDVISLSKAQLGFMNLFAIPLFQGVADILPAMQYCVDELEINKALFDQMIVAEQSRHDRPKAAREPTLSPKTMSVIIPAESEYAIDISDGHGKNDISAEDVLKRHANPEEKPDTNPEHKPPHIPEPYNQYKEVNGTTSEFEAVADFAATDPFNMQESRPCTSRKQRCSEATDGSASAPGTGDWASQATSATTGKMPLSPSTQGTSILSQESLDRPVSVPATMVTAPDEPHANKHQLPVRLDHKSHSDSRLEISPSHSVEDDTHSTSPNGKLSVEGSTLKKKSSRFRMNAFTFFRRHRGASPPLSAADTAG